jgi:6-phosphofructokinase
MGGNLLRSSRTNPLELDPSGQRVVTTMINYGIDALVVLGGNGSQRAARELAMRGIPLVFLPQSIDGDVPGSVTSIGFPSAVNRGAQELAAYFNTAHSCGRWFLVEVMGQNYGLLALQIGLRAHQGSYLMENGKEGFPLRVGGVFSEIPRPFQEIPRIIERNHALRQDHGVILISEKASLLGEGGQVLRPPPAENSGDMVRWLRHNLLASEMRDRTRAEALGYELRGALPTMHDRHLASNFATGALHLIDGGHFGRMVGVDFLPGTARLQMIYPMLSEVAGNEKALDPYYFWYVKSAVEGSAH